MLGKSRRRKKHPLANRGVAGEMTIIIRCVNKRMYVADYATQRAPGEVTSIDSELYMDDEEEGGGGCEKMRRQY